MFPVPTLLRTRSSLRSILSLLLAGSAAGCASDDVTDASAALAATDTVVSLTFDDATTDHTLAASMLEARGMRGTFYVNSGRLGLPGYLTVSQLASLAAAGHEIAGHTVSHADLPTMSEEEQRRQVCNDRTTLLAAGFSVKSFAYPYGSQNATTRQIAASCGYNSARGVGGIAGPASCTGCPTSESIPPANAMSVLTPDSVKSGTTLATLQGYVTAAESQPGRWLPIVFHHVCDGCDPNSISPATLASFLDWLAARRTDGTVVRTVDAVVGGVVLPGTPGPSAPPPVIGGNMLANPDLEVDANRDGQPDCWQRAGYGSNTLSWSAAPVPYEGSFSQLLTVSNYGDGGGRLLSVQDLGACAPAVFSGHQYTFTSAYTASAQPRVSAYYRNASGGWAYWGQSNLMPATSSWQSATWTTPPAPEGATAISIGLSLFSAGTLAVDALSLRDADAAAPTVTLASPADGTSLAAPVTLQATATDAGGVGRVDFLVDGVVVGSASTAPYTLRWQPASAQGGTFALSARAVDLAGNEAVSSTHRITITSMPPADTTAPTVSITAPATGTSVRGAIAISATATDDAAVQRAELLVNGAVTATSSAPPYQFSWDSATVAEGPVTLAVRATDLTGNQGSATVSLIVDRSAPTNVVIDSPANGASVTGIAPINVSARDNVGIFRVRFFLDGKQLGTRTTTPWRWNWDTTPVTKAAHVISVQVEDAAGNATPSSSINVTVR